MAPISFQFESVVCPARQAEAAELCAEPLLPSIRIVAIGGGFDPATCKAAGTAESLPGRVRLMAKKRGADSMSISMRRKGEPAFRLLIAQCVGFPVDDDTPPAVPGQSEVREYQFRGLLADEEIGQPSDIIPAPFTL